MAHRVTFIPGDEVGPELSEATRRVLEGTGVQFDWDVQEAGAEVIDKYGTPLPEQVLDSIRGNGVAIKEPLTTPIGTGFPQRQRGPAQGADLYACLRPQDLPGVRSRTRTSTWWWCARTTRTCTPASSSSRRPDAAKVIEFLNGIQSKKIREDSGVSIKPISIPGPGASPSSPSTTPAPTGARRSRRSPRPTS